MPRPLLWGIIIGAILAPFIIAIEAVIERRAAQAGHSEAQTLKSVAEYTPVVIDLLEPIELDHSGCVDLADMARLEKSLAALTATIDELRLENENLLKRVWALE